MSTRRAPSSPPATCPSAWRTCARVDGAVRRALGWPRAFRVRGGNMAHPVAGRIFAVVTAVFIAGCAGHNFVRPSDGAFTLGQTPYAQVVQQLGEPRRESTMLRNGKQIQVAS